jgi:hypothetical protein
MRKYLWLLLMTFPSWTFAKGRAPALLLAPYVVESGQSFSFRSFEDDQGGFYLIWPRAEGDQLMVMGQHMGAAGEPLWKTPGVVLASTTQNAAWDAVPDSQGGLLLTWEEDERVGAQRFDASAKPQWPAKDVRVSRSTFTQTLPGIAPDGSGGAYVIWQEKPSATRWVLMAQHLNALGAHVWTPLGTRVSLRPSNQRQAAVVPDGMAGIVVAWQDFRESASQLQAQRLNYQGHRLWGVEGVLITAPAGDPAKTPYVGAVGRGSALFAWQASAGADRIFLQQVTAAGQFNWGREGLEVSKGNWHEWNPVLHGDNQGGAWIGWEDYRNERNWQVFAHHLRTQGTSAWPPGETVLTSINADQGRLALTDDRQGGILAVWVDNRSGSVGIYLQQVNNQGQILLGPSGIPVADGLTNPQKPQIISLSPGEASVVWADVPSKGVWRLYWKRVKPFPPGR